MIHSSPPDSDSLIDTLSDPVLVVDVKNFRMVRRNKASETTYGRATEAPATCYGLTHSRTAPCHGPNSLCPLPEVVASGQACTVEHIHQDPQDYPRYFLVQAAPVRDSQGTIRWATETHTDITAQKAELARQATHDALTGIYNRYHFEHVLEQEMERAQRYGSPFSLIMLDIDHFKSVNDRFGHDTGDQVLRALANILKNRLRGVDILARWGGEELMILLPETSAEGAAEVAEALRQTVAEMTFPGSGKITISSGVAEYQSGEPLKILLKRLDDALYRAKRDGRNRVGVNGGLSETS